MRISKHVMALPVAELIGAPALNGSSKKSNGSSGGSANGGKQITVAFVPKLHGMPYFEAVNTCGQRVVEDLDFNGVYKGPTIADPGVRTDTVESLIRQKVDVLVASAQLNMVTLQRRGGDQ